jgi:hypothetical protein
VVHATIKTTKVQICSCRSQLIFANYLPRQPAAHLMLRIFTRLFRRPAIRMGRVDNARLGEARSAVRNAQFVSYLDASGSLARRDPNRHERRASRLRVAKALATLVGAAGLTWFAVESAHAFGLY